MTAKTAQNIIQTILDKNRVNSPEAKNPPYTYTTLHSNQIVWIGKTIRFCKDPSKSTVHFTEANGLLPDTHELQVFLRENPQIECIEVHPYLFDDYFLVWLKERIHRKIDRFSNNETKGWVFQVSEALERSVEFVFRFDDGE